MSTSKNISNLVINKVDSQAVYDSMKTKGLINEDELYVVLGTVTEKIDASSITGLDTYLSDKYYVKKKRFEASLFLLVYNFIILIRII